MHQSYLHQALQLAQTRRGYCAPNPAVAAIIVSGSRLIAQGVHYAAGFDHAEVVALANVAQGEDLSKATLYVTLEPCCHWGKTPPCTEAIIQSGIGHVYYGFQDPNPEVNGGGACRLTQAGISCEYIKMTEISEFYQSYVAWLSSKMPVVTAKIAMSLDGKIAGSAGEPLAITGAQAKSLTFSHRKHSDAILTTAQTIVADDPELNIRENSNPEYKPVYILDRQLRSPLSAKVFVNPVKITVFHSDQISGTLVKQYTEQGHRCVPVPQVGQRLDLNHVLKVIGEDGNHDLWVEAGSRLFNSLISQSLLHRALIYIAPKLIAEGISAFSSQVDWMLQAKRVAWYHKGKDAVLDIAFKDSKIVNEEVM